VCVYMCVFVCVCLCACTCTRTTRYTSKKKGTSCLFLIMYLVFHIDVAYNTRDAKERMNRGVDTRIER